MNCKIRKLENNLNAVSGQFSACQLLFNRCILSDYKQINAIIGNSPMG